jgi:hypothetical protein
VVEGYFPAGLTVAAAAEPADFVAERCWVVDLVKGPTWGVDYGRKNFKALAETTSIASGPCGRLSFETMTNICIHNQTKFLIIVASMSVIQVCYNCYNKNPIY